MSELNVANRTLAIMDNLPFLRSLNNECIDLIAIDPPFAANETFTSRPRPPISPEELAEEVALAQTHGASHNEGIGQTRVRDVWRWDTDVHPAWKAQIEEDHPAVFSVIEAVEACGTENSAAYICYMAVRLIECYRILKNDGSIYIHCDDRATSYLRLLLESIFGPENFRSQIVWRRATAHNDARRYGRITDYLLYFTKSQDFHWDGDAIAIPRTEAELREAYPSRDQRGRYRADNLTGPAHAAERGSPSTLPWRDYDIYDMRRVWSVPRTGRYAEYIENNYIPGYRDIANIHDRLDALEAAGLVHHPLRGRWPGLKRYADSDAGHPPQNLILSPIGFTNYSANRGEYTGYATQKPLALYERIITASSRPGDMVLDIFAGCATTAVASERLGRRWIACDMAYRSWTMLKRRFYRNGFALTDMTDSTRAALGEHQIELQEAESYTLGPGQLPARTDRDPAPFHQLREVPGARSTQTASWSGRIPKEDAKRLLIERFGPVCWGCGYEPRRPNGTLDDTLLEVDHIRARRAAEGTPGDDELYNLALLHRTCNGIKRNRLTLEQLREHNALNGLLYVDSVRELVDLFEATRFAAEQIAAHVLEQGGQ